METVCFRDWPEPLGVAPESGPPAGIDLSRNLEDPEYIRSDNGPEFIAQKVSDWIAAVGAKTAYIEPGSPWENGSSKPRAHSRHHKFPALIDQTEIDDGFRRFPFSRLRKWIARVTGRQ